MNQSEFVLKLKSLPPRERLIFVQDVILDMDHHDIAVLHGLTEEQVEQVLKETYTKLDLLPT